MTQDQLILLLLKIILIADVVSIVAFIADYSRMASWWRNPVGRTIVVKDILLVLVLIPSVLSLFFTFSRLSSHIAAWVDVALLGALAPVMLWRIVVWRRVQAGKADEPPAGGEAAAKEGTDAR